MNIRKPAVAGQFYPQQNAQCIDQITELLEHTHIPEDIPQNITAAIVPHAGWDFSGLLAATVFDAIKTQNKKVHTFILFGACHSYIGDKPAVYNTGQWQTPMGQIAVDEDIAAQFVSGGSGAQANPEAHRPEHSIEVQIPFIQQLFPGSKIVPILAPVAVSSMQLGTSAADIALANPDKQIVFIASTDLTHYGPGYGFIPKGTGPDGLKWAHQVNDQQIIDLALTMQADKIIPNATENQNACGPGAITAAIAAAKKLGIQKGALLAHTNSNLKMFELTGQKSPDSVGYTAIVY
jgi:hypothetical protein